MLDRINVNFETKASFPKLKASEVISEAFAKPKGL